MTPPRCWPRRDFPERGCLIVDYRLPGMNGLDMLSGLRARGTTMPAVLIVSGHADGAGGPRRRGQRSHRREAAARQRPEPGARCRLRRPIEASRSAVHQPPPPPPPPPPPDPPPPPNPDDDDDGAGTELANEPVAAETDDDTAELKLGAGPAPPAVPGRRVGVRHVLAGMGAGKGRSERVRPRFLRVERDRVRQQPLEMGGVEVGCADEVEAGGLGGADVEFQPLDLVHDLAPGRRRRAQQVVEQAVHRRETADQHEREAVRQERVKRGVGEIVGQGLQEILADRRGTPTR